MYNSWLYSHEPASLFMFVGTQLKFFNMSPQMKQVDIFPYLKPGAYVLIYYNTTASQGSQVAKEHIAIQTNFKLTLYLSISVI